MGNILNLVSFLHFKQCINTSPVEKNPQKASIYEYKYILEFLFSFKTFPCVFIKMLFFIVLSSHTSDKVLSIVIFLMYYWKCIFDLVFYVH